MIQYKKFFKNQSIEVDQLDTNELEAELELLTDKIRDLKNDN